MFRRNYSGAKDADYYLGEKLFGVPEAGFKVPQGNVSGLRTQRSMTNIRYTKTLFYFEGPQVIAGNDDYGQNFIGVMVEPAGLEERFVLKAVAAESLDHFQAGLVDLRSMFLERSEDEWFFGTVSSGFDEPFDLKSQTGPIDKFPFLPEPGFFLSEPKEGKENPSGRETGGVSAGKPFEISPPPLRREVEEESRNLS